jgi:hypothetical protein
MKTFEPTQMQCAQGDVLFTRIPELPKGAAFKEAKREGGLLVVAHSETGHHHGFYEPSAKLFEVPNDPFTCYLQLGGDCQLTHLRPHDTHEAILFGGGGFFEVRRQREYTPEGYRMVMD